MDKFDTLIFRSLNRIDLAQIVNDYPSNPISFTEYKKLRIEKLNQLLGSKTTIYLDLKFLIKLRDSISEGNTSIYKRIFFKLRQLVDEGKVICPISDCIIDEILKQTSIKTREKTALILDIVCRNISLAPMRNIFIHEFVNILLFSENKDLQKIQNWDFPISLFGNLDFETSDKNSSDLLKILFYEGLIATSIQEIITCYKNVKGSDISLFAETFFNSIKYGSVPQSFGKIVQNELIAFMISMGHELKVSPDPILEKIKHLDQETLLKIVPSIYVFCSLHAEMINDSAKKYKKNDYYDIIHCSLAIPNCNYFFTERGFMHRTRKVLKLDSKFKMVIESDPNKVMTLLNTF